MRLPWARCRFATAPLGAPDLDEEDAVRSAAAEAPAADFDDHRRPRHEEAETSA